MGWRALLYWYPLLKVLHPGVDTLARRRLRLLFDMVEVRRVLVDSF